MTSGKPQPAALDRHVRVPESDANPPRLALHWPRTSRLELGPLPSAVPCARLHAKVILREWSLDRRTDDVELIVSALTTNALKASLGLSERQPIAVDLLANHEWLIIQVWDALPTTPGLRPHAPDAEAGRGLQIVSMLSDRWGFYRPLSGGKAVWAAISVKGANGSGR